MYKRWNERLFQEMFLAYEEGRGGKDPSEGWYGGELWFFDNYVIPLAKKLEECGVFGVSSDECLNYALENRKEVSLARIKSVALLFETCLNISSSFITQWATKGKEIVEEMVERYRLWRSRGEVLGNPLEEDEYDVGVYSVLVTSHLVDESANRYSDDEDESVIEA